MKKILTFLFIFLIGLTSVAGESAKDETAPPLALVFNVPTLLTGDYSHFLGGFGGQLSFDQWRLRLAVGFYIDVDEETEDNREDFEKDEFDHLDFRIGLTAVYRFSEKKISPYLGLATYFSRNSDKRITDKDNWGESYKNFFAIGPVLGAEIMLMENFGIFAEYKLSAVLTSRGQTLSTEGETETKDGDLEWRIVHNLVNQGALGLVIYLP